MGNGFVSEQIESIVNPKWFEALTLDKVALFENQCNLKNSPMECLCVRRLCALTVMHFEFVGNKHSVDSPLGNDNLSLMLWVRDNFGIDYDSIRILNDFHHVLCFHDEDLEEMNQFLCHQITCPLSDCGCIARNVRLKMDQKERALQSEQSDTTLFNEKRQMLRRPKSATFNSFSDWLQFCGLSEVEMLCSLVCLLVSHLNQESMFSN